MTGTLAPLTVLAAAKVEVQAFAFVPLIEYTDAADFREPSLLWIEHTAPPQAPPTYLIQLAYLSALTAHASRASWFGLRKVKHYG